jgi:hypothetical protein
MDEAPVEVETPQVVRAVVIVGVGALPRDGRLTIVCESRPGGQPTTSGYAAGADLYFRTDDSVVFPKKARVVTFGVDATQGPARDFSSQAGVLNFAGAHPAYAAANLAFQNGATEIEVVGLTDAEKQNLRPSFDELPDRGFPVSVSLT